MAGYIIHFTSSIRSISQVGHFVGRGALLSTTLVLTLLPALLSLFDGVIMKGINRSEEKKRRRLQKVHAIIEAKKEPSSVEESN